MKIISWNVNGLRALIRKDALGAVIAADPDIFCIQETKASPDQVDPILGQYPWQYWNSALKKGYSGTAVFSRFEPLSVEYGMGIDEHDQEGRIITLEFPAFYLVNVYTPNSQRELTRLQYRMKWDEDFLRYIRKKERKKPVIFCGDLNVAFEDIDLARPDDNHNNAGFTDEERRAFSRILDAGFIDSFRVFNPDGNNYTWWSYIFKAREKNLGWRIDYTCLSGSLKSALEEAFILSSIMGSDHCPVGININTAI